MNKEEESKSMFKVPSGMIPLGVMPAAARDPMESCAVKAVLGLVMGGVSGAALGMLLGGYGSIAPPVTIPGMPEPPKVPMKWQLRESWMSTARRSRRWGKNFAVFTLLLQGVECCFEKYRAKHDMVNTVGAGCVTGAALAANQGPYAACFGCVGLAAFNVAIESLLGH